MADATLEYNFQQLHVAVRAQEALVEQLQATIAQQGEQVAELRTRLDALAHQAGITLAVPPPPASAEPSVQPQPVETLERPDHVSTHTTPTLQPAAPSVPRSTSRSRSSGETGPAQSQPQGKDKC